MVKVIASSTNMFSFVIKLNFRSLINFNLLFQLYYLTAYLILKRSLKICLLYSQNKQQIVHKK